MSSLTDTRSIESEIADCCHEMYRAEEADTALGHWRRLRLLIARQEELERAQFLREAKFVEPAMHQSAGAAAQ